MRDGSAPTASTVPTTSADRALVEDGIPFTQPPTDMGPVTTAVFDDTCGDLVQIAATR